jgi:hypothetical protein
METTCSHALAICNLQLALVYSPFQIRYYLPTYLFIAVAAWLVVRMSLVGSLWLLRPID